MSRTAGIVLIILVLIACASCAGRTKWALSIKTNPPDAEVYGDGKLLCNTPCEILIDRDPVLSVSKRFYSPNRITITKAGYREVNRIFTSAWDLMSDKSYRGSDNSLSIALEAAQPSYTQLPKRTPADTSAVPVPAYTASSLTAQRWAVVIGISKYKDTRIPPLRYASKDAEAFFDWLVSPAGGKYPPAHVRLIIDKEATGHNIKDALFSWLGSALAEDLVTIYFAGHGSPQSPDQPANLFLLPYDAQYDSIATTGFPMWDIETALKRFIKAKKVVVIADACHSGGVGQSFDVAHRSNRAVELNPISSGFQNLSRVGDGVAIISASDDKQLSQESQSWGGGHGVFTYFLLKGLRGEADYSRDGSVTLGELIPYLSEQVRRATRNAQSPTVSGKFDPALSIGR